MRTQVRATRNVCPLDALYSDGDNRRRLATDARAELELAPRLRARGHRDCDALAVREVHHDGLAARDARGQLHAEDTLGLCVCEAMLVNVSHVDPCRGLELGWHGRLCIAPRGGHNMWLLIRIGQRELNNVADERTLRHRQLQKTSGRRACSKYVARLHALNHSEAEEGICCVDHGVAVHGPTQSERSVFYYLRLPPPRRPPPAYFGRLSPRRSPDHEQWLPRLRQSRQQWISMSLSLTGAR